jgi:hypothetical protein
VIDNIYYLTTEAKKSNVKQDTHLYFCNLLEAYYAITVTVVATDSSEYRISQKGCYIKSCTKQVCVIMTTSFHTTIMIDVVLM